MKGGINKIIRNVVATKGKSDFDKRLIKATYHLDSKEPKEKHVIYLIESFRGTNPEVRPTEAFNKTIARFLKNISSWSLTTKIFVIFHRCLQDVQLGKGMAKELKTKEHLMHSFQKKASDQSYEAQMYSDLSAMYANYIKFLVDFKVKNDMLNLKMSEISHKAKSLSVPDLLFTYEAFDALITQIFNIFEHQNFCKQTRLWTNVILYLFLDLIKIYQVFYVLITEILERFPQLNPDQASKVLVMYQNFVNFTKILKQRGQAIMIEFGFHLTLPQYYEPDPQLVETLKICVNDKIRNPEGLAKVSQQLRSGMNRNQFMTNASQQSKDQYFEVKDVGKGKMKLEEDSDSGEDFDYGEEEDEYIEQPKDQNNDLMDYISNMDFSHFSTQNQDQPTTNQSTNQAPTSGNFFDFGTPATQNTSQPAQQTTSVNNDFFSLFDAPVQNTSPNIIQPSQSNSLFDPNKPLIPSKDVSPPIQSNQFDMFKDLYSNAASKPLQPLPMTTNNNFMMQQQQPQPMMNSQYPTGFNQFQSNMMGGGNFQQQYNPAMNMNTQYNPYQQQQMMYGNMNMQQNQPQMNQQFQSNMTNFNQSQFMTNQSQVNAAQMNMGQQQQQPNTQKEFTFW